MGCVAVTAMLFGVTVVPMVIVLLVLVAIWICGWLVVQDQECLSVSSPQRDSKNLRMPWPALPTGESSSLNISQLSKI